MSKVLCVTNRALCQGAFLDRVEALAAARPAGILLREKDLPEQAYRQLARQVLRLCQRAGVPCILHSFVDAAAALNAPALHVPLPVLRRMSDGEKGRFQALGASCHSLEEALEAQALGCTHLIAGHIFNTGCKPGRPGRGLGFLEQVCAGVSLPVYAIGGIEAAAVPAVERAGAAGVCVMSGAMQCANPEEYLTNLKEAGERQ